MSSQLPRDVGETPLEQHPPLIEDQDPKKFETPSGLFVGLLDHPIDVDGILAEMNTEWQSKLGDLLL